MNNHPPFETSDPRNLFQPRTTLGFYARAALVALVGIGVATFLGAREQESLMAERFMSPHGIELGLVTGAVQRVATTDAGIIVNAGGRLRACDQDVDGGLASCRSLF